MDDPGTGLDDGNTRLVDDGADEVSAPPRDENVDEPSRTHELPRALAPERVDRLHRSIRESH